MGSSCDISTDVLQASPFNHLGTSIYPTRRMLPSFQVGMSGLHKRPGHGDEGEKSRTDTETQTLEHGLCTIIIVYNQKHYTLRVYCNICCAEDLASPFGPRSRWRGHAKTAVIASELAYVTTNGPAGPLVNKKSSDCSNVHEC